MKNYIGVKIVKAEPKEKNGVPGYAVKYPDGYVSWSPKETFEKAYRELDCQDFINSAEQAREPMIRRGCRLFFIAEKRNKTAGKINIQNNQNQTGYFDEKFPRHDRRF